MQINYCIHELYTLTQELQSLNFEQKLTAHNITNIIVTLKSLDLLKIILDNKHTATDNKSSDKGEAKWLIGPNE